jgi:hypothetical protein
MNKKSLKFHIESNDYFGTLATVLDLMRQELEIKEDCNNKTYKIIQDKVKELIDLQENYKIIKKTKYGK